MNILFNMNLAKLNKGKRGEALNGFKEVCVLDPDKFEASSAVGLLSLQDGDAVTAIKYLEMAVATRPTDVDSLYNLGAASNKLGQNSDAIGRFKQALAVDPSHAPSQSALAMLESQGLVHNQPLAPSAAPAGAVEEDVLIIEDDAPSATADDEMVLILDDDAPSAPEPAPAPPPAPTPTPAPPLPVSGDGAGSSVVTKRRSVGLMAAVEAEAEGASVPMLNSALSGKGSYRGPSAPSAAQEAATEDADPDRLSLTSFTIDDAEPALRLSASGEGTDDFIVNMTFPHDQLTAQPFPAGVDPARREIYLSDTDFERVSRPSLLLFFEAMNVTLMQQASSLFVCCFRAGCSALYPSLPHVSQLFKITKDAFEKMPKWKQDKQKKDLSLF